MVNLYKGSNFIVVYLENPILSKHRSQTHIHPSTLLFV